MSETRKNAADAAIHIARNIEALLEFINNNEDDFVVGEKEEILNEIHMHEDIAKYMRLHNSFLGVKPGLKSQEEQ